MNKYLCVGVWLVRSLVDHIQCMMYFTDRQTERQTFIPSYIID